MNKEPSRQRIVSVISFVILIVSLLMCSCSVQKGGAIDSHTGLYVYRAHELEVPPLCNGEPYIQGFMTDFCRKVHFKWSDESPITFKFNIQFVVDKKGHLVGPRIYNKTPEDLNIYEKQVLDAVNKIQDWTPGKVKGKPVDVLVTIPIVF